MTETAEISADSLNSKLQNCSVVPLDNTFISSMLQNPMLCESKSIYGDLNSSQNMVFNSLLANLPEPDVSLALAKAVSPTNVIEFKHELPELG